MDFKLLLVSELQMCIRRSLLPTTCIALSWHALLRRPTSARSSSRPWSGSFAQTDPNLKINLLFCLNFGFNLEAPQATAVYTTKFAFPNDAIESLKDASLHCRFSLGSLFGAFCMLSNGTVTVTSSLYAERSAFFIWNSIVLGGAGLAKWFRSWKISKKRKHFEPCTR